MPPVSIDRNRLDESASPYLRQHADNPVHWQPWDDDALAAARDLDRPIFLSIGYAACHWCHVMEAESFADDDVATVLNERFVPIKVDREERPDVDQFYQTACQVTAGRGGWPLSVWMTPDARPFQVATYLPKVSRRGMPGFLDVLERIANRWRDDRADIDAHADQVVEVIRRVHRDDAATDQTVSDNVIDHAAQAILREVDWEHGGFGTGGPKFPQATRVSLLLTALDRTPRDRYGDAVARTLQAMADGGIHDHVGGGFHRYATDGAWSIPHFEKMAYDNALLLDVYARAATHFDDAHFERVAHRIASFVERDLQDAKGGVYASLDADTDGVEGATYLWTEDAIADAIDDPLRRSVIGARFDLVDAAELEGGAVLTVARSIDAIAEAHDLERTTVLQALDRGLTELHDARNQRPQPSLDDKVLAGWTGLMISGFTSAGLHLETPRYFSIAADALAFVEEVLWDAHNNSLRRRYRAGEVGIPAFLGDYAAVARGGFDLYRATDDPAACRFALALVDGLLRTCWDAKTETLRFAPIDSTNVPFDPLDGRDRATPSPVGLAVDVLATASGFLDDDRLDAAIEHVHSRFDAVARRQAPEHATLLAGLDRWTNGPPSLTIVADELPSDWREQLARIDRGIIVTRRPPGDPSALRDDLGLESTPPLWRDRQAVEGDPTVYPCRGRTCGLPEGSLHEALTWFET